MALRARSAHIAGSKTVPSLQHAPLPSSLRTQTIKPSITPTLRSRSARAGPSHKRPHRHTCASTGSDWLAPAREKRLITLAASLLFELAITGGLFWSPLLCALLFVVLTPSSGSQQAERDAAVEQAVERVRREMEARVPVTPPESAGWMNKMLAEIWAPFVVPQMLKENLSAWQEKVRNQAPAGWDIELQDMSMGVEGPAMSNYQVFNDPVTGRMSAMECDMLMDSSTMRVVVRGSGPLGSFTATVLGVTMKGRMRILPIPEQRMLLWSYIKPPDAKVRLQVRGPLIGERDVPEFSFIKSAFNAAIQDSLVEPRRAAASLDYEYLVQQAVNTNVNVYIESIDGFIQPGQREENAKGSNAQGPLLASDSRGRPEISRNSVKGKDLQSIGSSATGNGKQANSVGTSSDGGSSKGQNATAATSAVSGTASARSLALAGGRDPAAPSLLAALRRRPAVYVLVTNLDSKLQRRSATRLVSAEGRISLNELINVELGSKSGIVELQVRDASRGQVVLGRVLVHLMATKDGCTLMWALGRDREPLALRWQPAMGPWRVTLPLEKCASRNACITLGLSVDPWAYAAAQLPAAAYKTPGQRTVVLQIMEGKELAARDWAGTSDPYVQISYGGGTYRTRTIYNSLRPVWGETFVFPENASLLTRRVRMDVWDSGVSRDDSLGGASLSLDMAAESAIQDRWVQLAGEESGELRVRLVVVPGSPSSPAVQQMVALLSSDAFATASTSTLQVVVVAARGLMPRPSALIGTDRNAYASLTFAGARQVTPVIRGTTSPTWNHSSLFPLDLPSSAQRQSQPAHTHSQPQQPERRGSTTIETTASPVTTPAQNTSSEAHSPAAAPGQSPSKPTAPAPPTSAQPSTAKEGGAANRGPSQIRSWSLPPNSRPTPPGTASPPPSGPARSSGLKPYPSIPGDPAPASPARPGASTSSGLPDRSPHTPSILRVQVMDVAVIPPDEDLGYAELDVTLVVPSPGSVWEQWLPLTEGGNGEVLVRIAHMAPSTAAQGALPLPHLAQAHAEVLTATSPKLVVASSTAVAVAGQDEVDGETAGALSRVNKALLDAVGERVRAANKYTVSAVQTGEELRVKLGQDWIPKVQDWWGRMSTQTQNALAARGAGGRGSDGEGGAPSGGTPASQWPPIGVPSKRATTGSNGSSASGGTPASQWPPVGVPSAGATASSTTTATITNGETTGNKDSAGEVKASGAGSGPSSEPATPTLKPESGFWVKSDSLQQLAVPARPPDGIKAAGQQGATGLTWLGAWLQGGWPPSTANSNAEPNRRSRSGSRSAGPDASGNSTAPASDIFTPSEDGQQGPAVEVDSSETPEAVGSKRVPGSQVRNTDKSEVQGAMGSEDSNSSMKDGTQVGEKTSNGGGVHGSSGEGREEDAKHDGVWSSLVYSRNGAAPEGGRPRRQ